MKNNIFFTSNLMLFSEKGVTNLKNQDYAFNSGKNHIRNYKDVIDYIVSRWNNKIVDDSSIVYILGDIANYQNEDFDLDEICSFFKRLRGSKVVIPSEKDYNFWSNIEEKPFLLDFPISSFSSKDKKIVLCHYPLSVWEGRYKKASIHIHGHFYKSPTILEKKSSIKNKLNVCFNIKNPILSLDEVITLANHSSFKRNEIPF